MATMFGHGQRVVFEGKSKVGGGGWVGRCGSHRARLAPWRLQLWVTARQACESTTQAHRRHFAAGLPIHLAAVWAGDGDERL